MKTTFSRIHLARYAILLSLFLCLSILNAIAQEPNLWLEGTVTTDTILNDGFEDGNMPPFTSGGDATWFVQSATQYRGNYAAQSGPIYHNQSTFIQYIHTIAEPAELSFWTRISSEEGGDFLRVSISGDEQLALSGTHSWNYYNLLLDGTTDTIIWAYEKNENVSTGSDAAWLDDVMITTRSGKVIRIIDGTEGWGNVLTSDATGQAYWTSVNKAISLSQDLPIIASHSSGDGFYASYNSGYGVVSYRNSGYGVFSYSNRYSGVSSYNNGNAGIMSYYNESDGLNSHNNRGIGVHSYSNDSSGIVSVNNDYHGVYASNNDSIGIVSKANGIHGVYSTGNNSSGIYSYNNSGIGVNSEENSSHGLRSVNNGGDGLIATNNLGAGVWATNNTGDGITANANDDNGISASLNQNHGAYVVGNGNDGILSANNTGAGIKCLNNSGHGVLTKDNSGDGILSEYNIGAGINASNNQGDGIYAYNNSGNGVYIHSSDGFGVFAYGNDTIGIYSGYNADDGVYSCWNGGHGVYAVKNSGYGLYVTKSGSDGIYSVLNVGQAAYFSGSVTITGPLTKPAGSFKIDHPLDPENKYLYHSFVESPDMMNVYNGNVVLDGLGEATVTMPEWFEVLNRDFRYQLTAIGAPGPNLYISEEMTKGHFKIAGGNPSMKVSWQVTGIRQDPYANKHRIQVEEEKEAEFKGYYLQPDAYDMPFERSHDYVKLGHKTLEELKAETNSSVKRKGRK